MPPREWAIEALLARKELLQTAADCSPGFWQQQLMHKAPIQLLTGPRCSQDSLALALIQCVMDKSHKGFAPCTHPARKRSTGGASAAPALFSVLGFEGEYLTGHSLWLSFPEAESLSRWFYQVSLFSLASWAHCWWLLLPAAPAVVQCRPLPCCGVSAADPQWYPTITASTVQHGWAAGIASPLPLHPTKWPGGWGLIWI